MSDELLGIDLELLLCRYGRQRVLSALADAEGCSVRALEERLANIRKNRTLRNAAKTRTSLFDRLEADFEGNPQRIEELKPFVIAYENKSLFPTIKTIQRFLESNGVIKQAPKSRRLAGPLFIQVISRLSASDLAELRRQSQPRSSSDFALLSEAILNR